MRRQRPIPVPEWARALAPLDYQRFIGLVRYALQQLAEDHHLNLDTGLVTFAATDAELDLAPTLQACAADAEVDPDRWAERIDASLRSALVDPDDLEGVLASPRRVLDRLKVRLYPSEEVARSDAAVLHRPGPPGTDQVLVLDLAHTIVTLPPDRAAVVADGDDPDELNQLWNTAWDNTGDAETPEIDVDEVTEGVPVLILTNPTMFGATCLLWLERYFDPTPDGALVVAPTRHLVLVHPLRDTGAVAAIGAMASQAHQLWQQGPDPLTPHLLWWRGPGAWTPTESWVDENGLNLQVPDELGALLESLPEGAPGTPPPPGAS